MQKTKFINFINKYNLNGLCNSVKITNKDSKLLTSFTTDEKDVLGFVMYDNVNLSKDNVTFGIFNTSTLLKVLGAMQTEIDTSFDIEAGKVKTLSLVDDVFNSTIQLADLDIIEQPPTINETPQVDVKIGINSVVIDQFNKAKGALADSQRMAFMQDGGDIKLVLNHADHATDTITLDMSAEITGTIPTMVFNADKFKEIITANKDCELGTIELSSQGLMTITFKGEDFQSKYLQIMLQV
jgi:hypothetical protein